MKIKFIKEYRALVGEALSGSATCAVGTVVDTTEKSAMWLIDNGFAEEVKESGWWKPRKGEKYYFVNSSGQIESGFWWGADIDMDRFTMGNCFKTEGAAERCSNYLKAVVTVRQDEGVLTPKEVMHATKVGIIVGQIIIRDRSRNPEASVCNLGVVYPSLGTVYFSTKEHAQAGLDNHPDERKIIANYDWSRE